ncbi:MAG: hypothetical protein JOZ81_26455, partial [Chloroflexi bacterium]|nr:hypothetical protein [Chloroflexota bacterium]
MSAESGDTHRSIAAALRAAPEGSVVTVRAGNYPENLVLTKAVTITTSNDRAEVVISPANGRAVIMATQRATLRGLTLRGGDETCPVIDVPTGRLAVEDCQVLGAGTS